MTRGLLLLGFLVLPALPVAHAADQIVHGVTLIVKDPGAAAKRKVTLKAKETATDNTLVGDPTVDGATVTITLDGASPSTQTFTLPAVVSPTTHKPSAARCTRVGRSPRTTHASSTAQIGMV